MSWHAWSGLHQLPQPRRQPSLCSPLAFNMWLIAYTLGFSGQLRPLRAENWDDLISSRVLQMWGLLYANDNAGVCHLGL